MGIVKKYYSQACQDKWVIENVFEYKIGGYFLDIGAYNGVYLSNTYYLEKHLSWNGICIEADPKTFLNLQRSRKCISLNVCVGEDGKDVEFLSGLGTCSGRQGDEDNNDKFGEEIPMSSVSLSKILETYNVPTTIDYISLDVEGMEYEVMKSFPFDKYRFLCATIERPDHALRGLLKQNNYILVADIPGLDAFYIHSDIAESYMWRFIHKGTLLSFPLHKRLFKKFDSSMRKILRRLLK